MHRAQYGWAVIGVAVALGAAGGRSVAAPAQAGQQAADCHEAGVTLTFGVGSTEINDRGQTSLNGVARWMGEDQSRTVRVEGYADKTGTDTLNQELSQRRAEAAKDYLVGKGIDPNRITTEAHGEHSDRPDLQNTRAVAVVACKPMEAATETTKETTESTVTEETPPAAAETPPPAPEPKPAPPPTNVAINVMPAQPPPPPAEEKPHDTPPSGVGVQAAVGGYATGFVEGGARSLTDTGGSWDGRLTIGTRLPVAVEAAYVGSAQGINALGLDTNAILLGNGAEGALRINLSTTRIQPYIFGGAGWMRYQVENTANKPASMAGPDNVLTVPFGVGIGGRLGRGFVLDVRGTGRATFEDQILTAAGAVAGSGGTRMHSWNAGARLGWEF